jgi:hypothetical protein
MEFFGAKFSVALGSWKLRFVLMLEESEESFPPQPAAQRAPHHVGAMHGATRVR